MDRRLRISVAESFVKTMKPDYTGFMLAANPQYQRALHKNTPTSPCTKFKLVAIHVAALNTDAITNAEVSNAVMGYGLITNKVRSCEATI